ncbi:MAG TPA: hypothetical protein VMU51_21910 [Mycobacteriales bacterium]|nr:hypothetical protein [Mycobacteriales bacterium]
MRTAVQAGIVALLAVCAFGLVWLFKAPDPGAALTDKANVIAGVGTVLALAVTLVSMWPRRRRSLAAEAEGSQVAAAVRYLATETLRYWRDQASFRGITTPSPVAVHWQWAGEDVAVPAAELLGGVGGAAGHAGWSAAGQVFTAGVVTRLREQLYDGLGRQRTRVVVLGAAGAGKTAAMLLLLIDILEHRRAGPVPVWLTLGGWNPVTTPLREWAAATLARDYPGLGAASYGGPGVAAELIRTGQVALFLDGLDEMPPDLQGRALQAIDRDAAGLRVVLTSRSGEYATALEKGRLYGAAVIEVLPVGLDHAAAFLLAQQLGHRRRRWQQVIDQLRADPGSVAARTLTTPLALSLARDTYVSADPTDLLDTRAYPDPPALLRHLLGRSLTLAYPDPAERQHATRWLTWIAQHMGTSRDLRWWDLPTWTPVYPMAADVPRTLVLRRPTRRELRSLLGTGLGTGLMVGFLGGFTVALARELPRAVQGRLQIGIGVGAAAGVAVGLASGLAVGLADVWSTPLATARAATPIEAYRSDRRRTLMVGLIGGLAFGLWGWLVAGLLVGLRGGFPVAIVLGFGSGLAAGSGPTLKLVLLEVMWGLHGRRPRFMPLLQTALRRQVLRQAGAVYQFRHAALQDLLAAGEPTTARAATDRGTSGVVPDSVVPGTTAGDADPADETSPGTGSRDQPGRSSTDPRGQGAEGGADRRVGGG